MTASNGKSVLLVDDNQDAAESLRMLFEFYGYKATVRFDGQSGLNEALGCRPDFVVLDIGLPGFDGCDVVRLIRSMPEFRYTPVVALSRFADQEHRERAQAAGFNRYFIKPVAFESLRDYFLLFP